MRVSRHSRGFLIIFNLVGIGILVCAAAAKLALDFSLSASVANPHVGATVGWLAFFAVLIGVDLKARSSSQHTPQLVHPHAGGHIFFAPVWLLGAGFLVLYVMTLTRLL